MSVSWQKVLTVDDVKYRTVSFDLSLIDTNSGLNTKAPTFLNENLGVEGGNHVGGWSTYSGNYQDEEIKGVAGSGLLTSQTIDLTGWAGTDYPRTYFNWPNSVSYPAEESLTSVDLIDGFMGGTVAVPMGLKSHGMHELEGSFIFSNDSSDTNTDIIFSRAIVTVWRAYADKSHSLIQATTTPLKFVLVGYSNVMNTNPNNIEYGGAGLPDHGAMSSYSFRHNIKLKDSDSDWIGKTCYYAFALHSFGPGVNGFNSYAVANPEASSNSWPMCLAGTVPKYSVRATGSIRYKAN